jgi:alpha-mannosidase
VSRERTTKRCYFLGHSHLDAAWLWSFDETRRVFGEGCENVLKLMENHRFTFCQSSAQYYKWLEEEHPETFEKVRRKVKEGTWEIVGGAWVEPDGNMPSGESFVRQFLLGKRYFMEKFGVDVKVAWFPDSFGYAWTLPQIMRKSGMEFFLTQKMLWNDTTAFPHYFFRWTSPDGSSILAHEMVGAYDEKVSEQRILEQLKQLKARDHIDDLLVLFGEGDHGGGVTEDMIQRALEFVNGDKPAQGSFTTSMDYLKATTRKLGNDRMPEVDDELYFQFHRGTYTTQARTKRNNRKAECLLEVAEKFATVARLMGRPYPASELNEAWRRLLLNQFHDILPGSSIPEVYKDSQMDFDSIFRTANEVVSSSLKAIASGVDTSGDGRSILVFNPLSWSRSGIVEVQTRELGDGSVIVDQAGRVLSSQAVEGNKTIFMAQEVPSIGYKEYRAVLGRAKKHRRTSLSSTERKDEIRIENEFLIVRIDRRTGLLKSVFDKRRHREVLQRPGGLIQVFEDNPVRGRTCVNSRIDAAVFDAWELFIYQQEGGVKCIELDEPVDLKLVEKGPIRARVQAKYVYAQKGRPNSKFAQEIILCDSSPLVEFRLDVDWHAEHRLAKVAFPLAVSSDFTTYEIPYGHITRRNPISPNATLAERSKYEAPGQKWIDHTAEDESYGVSLLNDCKYGFDVGNDVMRMTLLRSAEYPFALRAAFGLPPVKGAEEQLTDQGEHHVAYALYPHAAGFKEALTAKRAYEFNYPMLPALEPSHRGRLPKALSFITTHPENVILTTVKKAEDTNDVILRVYETSGKDTDVTFDLAWTPKKAAVTDLMEAATSKVPVKGRAVGVRATGHEIATVRVSCESAFSK